jgi:hypothetical protein
MLVFEIASVSVLFLIVVAASYLMTDMMNTLDGKMHFIVALWITTAWGSVFTLSSAIFVLDILKSLFGL